MVFSIPLHPPQKKCFAVSPLSLLNAAWIIYKQYPHATDVRNFVMILPAVYQLISLSLATNATNIHRSQCLIGKYIINHLIWRKNYVKKYFSSRKRNSEHLWSWGQTCVSCLCSLSHSLYNLPTHFYIYTNNTYIIYVHFSVAIKYAIFKNKSARLYKFQFCYRRVWFYTKHIVSQINTNLMLSFL